MDINLKNKIAPLYKGINCKKRRRNRYKLFISEVIRLSKIRNISFEEAKYQIKLCRLER